MLIINSHSPILLLLLSVFFFKVIKSQNEKYFYGETNYNLKNIESLQVTIFNTTDNNSTSECPKYSIGPRVIYTKQSDTNPTGEIRFCDVSFACNSEKCVYYKSPYNTYKIENGIQYGLPYIKEDNPNIKKKLYIHACSLQNESCYSKDKCTKDDDCFSRNCKKGRCIVNKDKSISLCRIKRNVTDDLYIKCALNVNEFCNYKNDKCYTNKCNTNYQFCYDENAKYDMKYQKLFFIFMGIILLLALSCIIYLYNFRDKLFSNFESQTDSSIVMNETNNNNSSRHSRHSRNNSDDDSDIVFNNIYYHN
ncbi:hypothetical protein BCR32DRAFT_270204 [Anaeromyces robustus]|uniref:Uncharacterized protein n=1 Tax=Anaeromyces robustus TaxID=1754192 RepID=A0A1Y1WXI6_9FUNG|nr:hypothetical protein BCR32DRAFT_270204 [Anaeromyces robustus]|eukprot:ORX78223.1 hypothetical protein BCR32DRAFT_270204 [Anaeromyces robustus]